MITITTSAPRINQRKKLRDRIIVLRASDFIGMEVNSTSSFDHPVCNAVERQLRTKGVMITDCMPAFKSQFVSVSNTMQAIKGYYGRIEFTQDMKKAKAYGFTNVAVRKIELHKGEYIW